MSLNNFSFPKFSFYFARISFTGRNPKAFFRLARSHIALGEYSSAIDTLQKALNHLDNLLKQHLLNGNNSTNDENNPIVTQKQEFQKLLALATRKQKQSPASSTNADTPQDNIKSIKLEPRTPSIREFTRPTKSSDTYRPLGEGNFSTVVICQHKSTGETFALKIIEKETCKKLAKRQHPNVHNEVFMERRILTQNRLPHHVNIIKAYHSMQDYGNLYFLMDLHQDHGDLWSQIRYQKCMVGCHSSLIRTYAYELLAALEHCHKHGIVHRDIKPENVLLSQNGGHVILIDFGTAKDLVHTDLNGPEFVGTPDFMSPEAVREFDKSGRGCDFTADLWALGVILYQLYAGALPFEAASPYMTFLKIQRGNYGRNMGVWDDDAWDLIGKLMKVDPSERLGAEAFEWVPPPKKEEVDEPKVDEKQEDEDINEAPTDEGPNDSSETTSQKIVGKIIEHGKGYDIIRQHPFFAKHESTLVAETNSNLSSHSDPKSIPQPIPSLRDLALRAAAHFIDESSLNVDLEDIHPPGDNSTYDALRLKPSDRARVMHLLDRLHLLKEPRIYRRFFVSKQDARLGRVRPQSRDVIGLTQMNDKMGQFPGSGEEEKHPDQRVPTNLLSENTKICIHHITNPLFSKAVNGRCSSSDNEIERKRYIKQLKESIRLVNRVRPKVVIACGYFDDSCRKLLSKVNETVPVILHDGTSFFNFWVYGAHCLAVRVQDFLGDGLENSLEVTGTVDNNCDDERRESRKEAIAWLRMELEQIKTARSHGYIFVDGDPRDIPPEWIAKMGKSHVLGVLGSCSEDSMGSNGCLVDTVEQTESAEQAATFEMVFVVANQTNQNEVITGQEKDERDDDEISTSSSESGNGGSPPDANEHVMRIVGRSENGVRCITVEEEQFLWKAEVLL